VNGVELAAVAVCVLPLSAAVANGVNALTGERLFGHVAVARIAVITVVGSFVASLYIAAGMLARPGNREFTVYRFISSGNFSVDFGFLLDPLSVVMMLVVTGISALVTHFSVNYMHNENGFTRYFTVVPLFVFAMLVLVMADNYLVMFLGWEGVGICSYLLIAFYRERPASAQAATKAFVMNRLGDAGLLVAMFLLVVHTGGLQYGEVFARAPSLPRGVVEAVGLLLLLGATGKSAQLPLGTWLARAMEGPTPSSALMHAATMVTAGVYLVVRSAPIYDQAPNALIAVGIVGAATALYGQLVGYAQTDIKGMLAASTTAQLGLMFLFCGLGLYAVAIFHLVAHAFYKSYLFLTAPSILHHLHGGADPTAVTRPANTARLPAVAALAVAAGLLAVPLIGRVTEPASGGGLTRNVWGVLALAVIAIFAAVLSTRRMTAVAFAGHGSDEGHTGQTKRRTARLVVPLCVLFGFVALGVATDVLPGGLDGSWFQRLLGPVGTGSTDLPLGNPILATLFIAAIALLLLSGWYGPRYLDRFRDELPAAAGPPLVRRLYWGALNRGYLDDVYGRVAVAPTLALGRAFERFDRAVLDRPPPSATPPAGLQLTSWEERFHVLRSGQAAGATALAEPPERLDWLPAGPDAALPRPQDHPHGAVLRTGATARRVSAWSERVIVDQASGPGLVDRAANALAGIAERTERTVFQPSGRGLFDRAANVLAGIAERTERTVFQPLDTTTLKLTGLIAGITDAFERAVFQSGVERGVVNAAAGGRVLRVDDHE
jgi:NADH-quinone oxidoreductase subunit L